MRLGCTDEWFGAWYGLNEHVIERAKELEVTGLGLHHPGDPAADDLKDTLKKHKMIDKNNMRVAEFWGEYPKIISNDKNDRKEAVLICKNIVTRAKELDSAMACLRPYSFNHDFKWASHPDNYTQQAEDNFVECIKPIMDLAEKLEIPVGLECHANTTLTSPKKVKRIIDRVGSNLLKYNLDIPNFTTDVQKVFNSTKLIDEVVHELGDHIISVHLKDLNIGTGLPVSIYESIPGTGYMDWDHLLTKFEMLNPDGYALIEHLPSYSDQYTASQFIRNKAKALKIEIIK